MSFWSLRAADRTIEHLLARHRGLASLKNAHFTCSLLLASVLTLLAGGYILCEHCEGMT